MSKRAIGYCRVSSSEQAQSGYSLDNQKARTEDSARAREWELVGVYEDGGYWARNLKRPGIQELIEDAKAKRFDVVIVHKLDRLTRHLDNLCDLLDGVFKANGVDFVSVSEGFDTSTASGRLVVNVLGAVAQWEREITSERIKEIAHSVKSQGRRWGEVDYGFKVVDGRLVEDLREQEVIREARRLRQEGKALRAIRQSLKEMGYINRKGNGFLLSVLSRMVVT